MKVYGAGGRGVTALSADAEIPPQFDLSLYSDGKFIKLVWRKWCVCNAK